jgi:hypothetical protein
MSALGLHGEVPLIYRFALLDPSVCDFLLHAVGLKRHRRQKGWASDCKVLLYLLVAPFRERSIFCVGETAKAILKRNFRPALKCGDFVVCRSWVGSA